MARKGINRVTLIGNIGADLIVRYIPSGGAVTNASLATSESWKDTSSGETQRRTEWHRIVFFNKLAEIAGEYLRKGAQIYVEGRLRTRTWNDQNGQSRYTTEIIVSDMQMLGSVRDTPAADVPPQAQDRVAESAQASDGNDPEPLPF